MKRLFSPRSVPFLVWGLLPLLFLLGGCATHYDMSDDLHNQFDTMVANYRSDTEKYAQETPSTYKAADLPPIPAEFLAPGHELQGQGVNADSQTTSCTLDDLYVRALQHSSQIRVFSDLPLIRQTGVQEAAGDFDTHAFVEGSYDRENVPTGSILTTGGPPRLIQDDTGLDGGLRKKLITGTEVTLEQKVDHITSNSLYLTPDPQDTASISLTVEQPLLKGAGIAYNEATMRVAEIDSEVAKEEFIRQSESHLLEISRAYWGLYLARSIYYVKKQLADETDKIVSDLEARTDVDEVKRQVLRARAAQAERHADLVRSEAAIRNAQDRLVALINDPELERTLNLEVIPASAPMANEMTADLRVSAQTALKTRPEISQGFFQLKAAAIREKMQRNEVLPTLDVILQGTLSGLEGSSPVGGGVGDAYDNQYNQGGPGYMVGFKGEIPLENNSALARLERRKLELRQQFDQLQTTIETVLLEVKVSVREVQTSYRDLQAKYSSYQAAKEELDDLHARKDFTLGGKDSSAPTYFEYVLESQDRLVQADAAYLNSLATYNVAVINMQKAQGTLLSYKQISIQKGEDKNGLPELHLEKNAQAKDSDAKTTNAFSVMKGAPAVDGDAALARNPAPASGSTPSTPAPAPASASAEPEAAPTVASAAPPAPPVP